jgi:hypothetical protein
MKGDKISTALKYRHVAEITGEREFPIDMLRYDRCSPWEERDALMIQRTLNPMIESKPWRIRVMRYYDTATVQWSLDRWNSYHCEVTEINGYEPRREEQS